jgi:prevent-host-death family protein
MSDRDIPQRELRNDVAAVLREVEAGASLRVTVRGRPVAELVPVSSRRRALRRSELARILDEAPLDDAFAADVDAAVGSTIDEL